MAILKINLNDPLMKAIKAVNSIGGKSLTQEDLKKQRSSMELASKLATPNDGFTVESFIAEGVSCEWVKPDLAHNPNYIILYAHGGGYTCGGLGYARILAAKLAISTDSPLKTNIQLLWTMEWLYGIILCSRAMEQNRFFLQEIQQEEILYCV